MCTDASVVVIRICKLFIFSSSLKPLNRFGPNLAEMFIGRSSTRCVIRAPPLCCGCPIVISASVTNHVRAVYTLVTINNYFRHQWWSIKMQRTRWQFVTVKFRGQSSRSKVTNNGTRHIVWRWSTYMPNMKSLSWIEMFIGRSSTRCVIRAPPLCCGCPIVISASVTNHVRAVTFLSFKIGFSYLACR
jgi:5-methylcytosine-specific restriction endonuclease McrA